MDYKYNVLILFLPLLFFLYILNLKHNKSIEKFSTQSSNQNLLISKILGKNIQSTNTFLNGKNITQIFDLVNYNSDLNTIEKKRLDGYLSLIKINLIYDDKIIILLNNNIFDIKSILDKKQYLTSKELFGLDYYVLGKVPNKYYFDFVDILKLDVSIPKKDLYDILILLDYYDVLNFRDKSNNSDITLQIKFGKNGWIYKLLTKLKNNNYLDSVFIKYNILDKVNKLLDKLNIEYQEFDSDNIDKTDFGELNFKSEEDKFNQYRKKYFKELYEKEYKTLETLNNISNTELKNDKKIDFNNLLKEFSNSMIDILNELIILFVGDAKKLESLKIEPYIDSSDTINNIWNRYIYYFRMLVKILLKEERLMYLGLFLVFISILLLLSNN